MKEEVFLGEFLVATITRESDNLGGFNYRVTSQHATFPNVLRKSQSEARMFVLSCLPKQAADAVRFSPVKREMNISTKIEVYEDGKAISVLVRVYIDGVDCGSVGIAGSSDKRKYGDDLRGLASGRITMQELKERMGFNRERPFQVCVERE